MPEDVFDRQRLVWGHCGGDAVVDKNKLGPTANRGDECNEGEERSVRACAER